jgi:hypothetical protein
VTSTLTAPNQNICASIDRLCRTRHSHVDVEAGSNAQENQNWKTSTHANVNTPFFGAYHNAASVVAMAQFA